MNYFMYYKLLSAFFAYQSIVLYWAIWKAQANETLISEPDFVLDVWTITPWRGDKFIGDEWAVVGANEFLAVVIQNLMIFIGGFALLVMTIWAWYMILHRWDDASLSKWKEIFFAWIIGLCVALFSYLIVSTLRFIIYNI